MPMADDGALLLIGATGYLGSLVASDLLSQRQYRLVAPLRPTTSREKLLEKINSELAASGLTGEIDLERLITVELPPKEEIDNLLPVMQKLDVQEIIHCAGSVDYFDCERLKEVNIDLTNVSSNTPWIISV